MSGKDSERSKQNNSINEEYGFLAKLSPGDILSLPKDCMGGFHLQDGEHARHIKKSRAT